VCDEQSANTDRTNYCFASFEYCIFMFRLLYNYQVTIVVTCLKVVIFISKHCQVQIKLCTYRSQFDDVSIQSPLLQNFGGEIYLYIITGRLFAHYIMFLEE